MTKLEKEERRLKRLAEIEEKRLKEEQRQKDAWENFVKIQRMFIKSSNGRGY